MRLSILSSIKNFNKTNHYHIIIIAIQYNFQLLKMFFKLFMSAIIFNLIYVQTHSFLSLYRFSGQSQDQFEIFSYDFGLVLDTLLQTRCSNWALQKTLVLSQFVQRALYFIILGFYDMVLDQTVNVATYTLKNYSTYISLSFNSPNLSYQQRQSSICFFLSCHHYRKVYAKA